MATFMVALKGLNMALIWLFSPQSKKGGLLLGRLFSRGFWGGFGLSNAIARTWQGIHLRGATHIKHPLTLH